MPSPSQAQVNPARLIQQLLNAPGADRRSAQSAAPHQQQQAQSQPQAPLQPGVWATKGEFLEATRRGELSGISQLAMPHRDAEFEPVLRSITQFLYSDYGVPQLPSDRNCHMEYRSAVRDLMRMVTEVTAGSLGDRGPDFQRPTSSAALRDRAQTISRAGGWCDSQPLGRETVHPYKPALIRLMDEYGRVTQEWVQAERGRRVAAFQEEQSRMQAERDAAAQELERRKAEAREAEQRQIDAERQRIEAEQQRRQQIEKKRIAG